MKSNLNRNMSTRKAILGLRKHMADGGDIISRGAQHTDDAIEAMSKGDPAPTMQQTIQQHPVQGPYPTDATPALDKLLEFGIKMGMRAGGPVRGPGGPTDDKVPAMLSHGEYVLPADTVQAVGKKNLDTLRDKTHAFVGPKPGMADGGTLDPFAHQELPHGFGGDIVGPQMVHSSGFQARPAGFTPVTPYQGDIRSQFDQALGTTSMPRANARQNSFLRNSADAAGVATMGIEDPVARAAQEAPILAQGRRDARVPGLTPLLPPPNGGQLRALSDNSNPQPLIPPPNNGTLTAMADGGMLGMRKPSMFGGQPFANGGLAMYDEAPFPHDRDWTGSPGLRFLANGGMPTLHMVDGGLRPDGTPIFPDGAGIQVGHEIPEQIYPNTAPGASQQPANYGNRTGPTDPGAPYRTNAPEGQPQFHQTPAPGAAPGAAAEAAAEAAPQGRLGKALSGLRKVGSAVGSGANLLGGIGLGAAGINDMAMNGIGSGNLADTAAGALIAAPYVPAPIKTAAYAGEAIGHGANWLMDKTGVSDAIANHAQDSAARDYGYPNATGMNDAVTAQGTSLRSRGAPPQNFSTMGLGGNVPLPAPRAAAAGPNAAPADPNAVGAPGFLAGSGATSFAGRPLGYGAQTGNLRTFSDGTGNVPATMGPQDFANLAKGGSLTSMSADAFTHPGSGTLDPGTPELGSTGGRGGQDQGGGVFHMPRRDPMDSINSHADALEQQIGPIGTSAARLRALQGIEGDRASMGANIFGTQTQGEISRNAAARYAMEFGRQMRNDQFEHGFQNQELNLRQINEGRQLRTAGLQYEQGQQDRNIAQTKDLYDNQIPSMLPGLGVKTDEKGQPDAAITSDITRRLKASEPSILSEVNGMGYPNVKSMSQVPRAMLPELVKTALQNIDDDKSQQGFGGMLRGKIMGSPQTTSDIMGNSTPTRIEKGAIGDMVVDNLGRKSMKYLYLRRGRLGGAVDEQRLKALNGLPGGD